MDQFHIHFTHSWKERNHRISAKSTGYEALLTTKVKDKENQLPNKLAQEPQYTVDVDGFVKMFYCWTHGLGFNPKHTSCTCNSKAEGHRDEATVKKRLGGSNRIMSSRQQA